MNFEHDLRTVADILQEMRDSDYSPFVVDGLISSAMTTVLGRPKAGKSFLTIDIARSLITGQKFLGREVRHTVDRVAFLCTDAGGRFEFAQRMDGTGLDPNRVLVMGLDTPEDAMEWKEASEAFRRLRIGAVIVDNTSDLATDTNDPRSVKIITDGLARWADNSIVVLNVHHTGKQGGMLGSTVWEKMTRSILTLARHGQGHTLTTKGNESGRQELPLKFNRDSNPFFSLSGAVTEGNTRERERSREWMDRNAKIWQLRDSGLSQSQVATEMRVSVDVVKRADRARRKVQVK